MPNVRVGTAVIIKKKGKILIGQRKGAHGEGTWCPPGGLLEFQETFEQCAKRETKEETGLDIENIQVITAINNPQESWGTHYVTIFFSADWKSGEPIVCEPDKCTEWKWVNLNEIPEPKFAPFQTFLDQQT